MHRSFTVLVAIFCSLMLTCKKEQKTEATDVRLFSFESAGEINAFKSVNCRVGTVGNVTDRTNALKITVLQGQKASVEISAGDKPWDWRGHDRLALDIVNPNDEEISFQVRLDDDPAATDTTHSVAGAPRFRRIAR